MTPTVLNLFFVQGMLSPEDPKGWEKFKDRSYAHAAYTADPGKFRAVTKRYREKNPEKANASARAWRKEHPDEQREASAAWDLQNPDRRQELQRLHRAKPTSKAVRKVWETKRKAEDVGYRILCNLRRRTQRAVALNSKATKTSELVGCSMAGLREHLEKQFRPSMTWENYGPVWSIDHIRPCSSFDFLDPAQQRECFHWSNLQPLFVEENSRKGNRVSSK